LEGFVMRATVGALCAVAVAAGVCVPAAATPQTDVLGDSVRGLVDDGFPAAIAYARKDSDRRRVAAGYADVDGHRLAAPGDRFRIASNTKAFTSAVLLQLAGEGRLSLADPVARWLPGVVAGNGNDGTKITVRQLLNHTSGLYDPTNDAAFWAPYLNGPNRDYVYRPKDIVAMAVTHPPTGQPGGRHDYSNTNYLVAGMIIEAVTGHSAVSQVYRRILVPLHLVHTSFPTADPRLHGRHLHGYDLAGNDITRFSPSYDWTAGAIVSTVDDLATFHRALFDGTLLKPAQLAELKTTVPTGDGGAYGLGVERRDLRCPKGTVTVWGNTGGGPGFNSYSLLTENTGRQLVLAMNTYDIAAELANASPLPDADPSPALLDTFSSRPAGDGQVRRVRAGRSASTRAAAFSRGGSRSRRMASSDVRLAWAETFRAATTLPDRSRIGTARARRPSSSSWFTSAHPCDRTRAISPRSAVTDDTVRAVSGSIRTTDR
jgi:D-alanyl-D-alanine carboxypeptidase